jgi:carbon monoxide dehydrogenase subunit G
VLLNIAENLEIAATQPDVWALLNDTPRLAALVPGVEEAVRIEDSDKEAYRVRVTEKVGPFKITMKLEVTVNERVEPATVAANVKGGDAMGMARATGTIGVQLQPSETGTQMTFAANVEVVGKMATLGAPVVRRRVTELFAEFGRRVVAEFQAVES